MILSPRIAVELDQSSLRTEAELVDVAAQAALLALASLHDVRLASLAPELPELAPELDDAA